MPFFRKCIKDQAVFNASRDVSAINTLHSPLKAAYHYDKVPDACRCKCKPTNVHAWLLPHNAGLMIDLK